MGNIKIDKIIRTRRRTFSLEINSKTELIVRAPLRASDNEIERIVDDKSKWIIKKKKDIKFKESQKKKREFKHGELFECLGKEYPLKIKENYIHAFLFTGKELILNAKYKRSARKMITLWYKNQALKYITRRIEYFSKIMGVTYNNIKITDARTRWGSCSYNKNLNFSWRLILAPVRVVDYVVVHELVHLIEMSHSLKFWRNVAKIMPNYIAYEKWLKENGHILDL